MSRTYVPRGLREEVAADARHRCGYCLTSALITGTPMELDHLIPQSLGGPTVRMNLWLACSMCNDHKGNRIAAVDPLTGEPTRLFDPRRQVWSEHLSWSAEGDRIVGQTPCGRATVIALRLNRAELVEARRGWVLGRLAPTQGLNSLRSWPVSPLSFRHRGWWDRPGLALGSGRALPGVGP